MALACVHSASPVAIVVVLGSVAVGGIGSAGVSVGVDVDAGVNCVGFGGVDVGVNCVGVGVVDAGVGGVGGGFIVGVVGDGGGRGVVVPVVFIVVDALTIGVL